MLAGIVLVSWSGVSDRRWGTWVVLFLGCATFVLLAASYYAFTVDDSFISLRYARNLAGGHGLVFNTEGGARVEGYSNFLWVILETPAFLLRMPNDIALQAVKVLGMAFGVGIVIVVFYFARLLGLSDRAGLMGSLVLCAIPQLPFWAISCLETPMFMFWLMLGLYFYVRDSRRGRVPIPSLVFLTLAALTRPEGYFLALGVLTVRVAVDIMPPRSAKDSGRLWRSLLALGLFLLFCAPHLIWRYRYYGNLLPNTFYAKRGVVGPGQVWRRFREIWPFLAYVTPLAVLGLLGYVHSHSVARREKMLLALATILLFVATFVPAGEWMNYRYELPFVPPLLLLAAAGFDWLLALHSKLRPITRCFSSLVPLLCLSVALFLPDARALQKRMCYARGLARAHVALGRWLKKDAPQDASCAIWDVGAVPFYSELPTIYDIFPDALVATHTADYASYARSVLSHRPTFIVLRPKDDSNPYHRWCYAFYESAEFTDNYEYLFSYAFHPQYYLAVYRDSRIVIPDSALNEGGQEARRSISSANADHWAW